MALAYRRPAHFLAVPPAERASRAQDSDDLCVIDDREFLIRGVLELPIKGGDDHFDWGPWALVEEKDFVRYLEAWQANTEPEVPPFTGWLSGGLRAYPDSDGLAVSIHLRGEGKRPLFRVLAQEHPIAVDQREGITMADVHRFHGL